MTNARVRPHVARVLGQARAVVLVSNVLCELVGDDQAPVLAEAIRDRILADDHKMSIITYVDDDPFAMLAYAHSLGPADGADAELIMRAAELSAAETATVSPEARQVLDACQASGRRVAVMSVHCAEEVETALGLSGVRSLVGPVIGRGHLSSTTWDLLAITDLIRATVREMGEEPANCAVVGSSVAAMYAAREAGVGGIGVVNKHASRKHLAWFDAVVVPSLSALSSALTTVPPTVCP